MTVRHPAMQVQRVPAFPVGRDRDEPAGVCQKNIDLSSSSRANVNDHNCSLVVIVLKIAQDYKCPVDKSAGFKISSAGFKILMARVSGSLQHPAGDLVGLDRFKQGFKVTFAKAIIAFALNEFEENRTNDRL